MCRSPSSSGLGGSTGGGWSGFPPVSGRAEVDRCEVEPTREPRSSNCSAGNPTGASETCCPVDFAVPAASSAGTAGHHTPVAGSTERGAVSSRGGDGRGRARGQAAVTGRFTEVPAMTQQESSTVQPPTGETLTADERGELLRLRREVEALNTAARPPRRKFRWRSLLAVVLIVLGCVLAPVAGVSVWMHNQVSDTDRFVRTMTPLVSDPDVQSALTNRLTATVFQYVDVQGLADDAVDALAAQGLPPQLVDRLGTLTPTLTSAVTGFVHDKIAELVASPAFASAWNQAIRVAHGQAVTLLSGDSKSVVIEGDTVYLDLAPFIDLTKQRLSEAGLTAVDLVPEVHPTVALAKADTLVRAQSAYSTLDTVARVLPWIVLLLLAVGVYLARNRFRAL